MPRVATLPDAVKDAGGRSARESLAFRRGMIAALAVVAALDEETVYREIVHTQGARSLVEACEGAEDFEWSGLARYYRRHRRYLKGRP